MSEALEVATSVVALSVVALSVVALSVVALVVPLVVLVECSDVAASAVVALPVLVGPAVVDVVCVPDELDELEPGARVVSPVTELESVTPSSLWLEVVHALASDAPSTSDAPHMSLLFARISAVTIDQC